MDAKCHACIGGTNVKEDIVVLDKGVHTVVGTPGRVFDMISRRHLGKYVLEGIIMRLATCCRSSDSQRTQSLLLMFPDFN